MTDKIDLTTHSLSPPPVSRRHCAITLHRAVLLLLALLMGSEARSEAPSTPVDAVDAFHQSLRSGDRGMALTLLAEDLIVFEQGHIDLSRATYAAGHLNSDMDLARAAQRRVLQRWIGGEGDVRWVLTRYRLTGEHRGKTLNQEHDETMILRKIGGHWRIGHIHWSAHSR